MTIDIKTNELNALLMDFTDRKERLNGIIRDKEFEIEELNKTIKENTIQRNNFYFNIEHIKNIIECDTKEGVGPYYESERLADILAFMKKEKMLDFGDDLPF